MSDPVILTLLLTDLVDSTQIVADLGDARATALMAAHDRRARDLLVVHHGREIDKSDGFLMTFEDAADGVRYALAYHAALREMSADLGRRLAARAGLHTGSVRLLWNSAADVARGAKLCEVEGIAKATAARIMTLALGGQTLISPTTAAALPALEGIRRQRHGHFRLKGVSEPLELFEVGRLPHAPMRPPPDSRKVHRVIQTDAGWRPAREIPHNLPPSRGAFIGRRALLRAVADAFDDDAALVSLYGPGGTGKTRLALQYAAAWMGDWPGGAWLCDLSETRDALGIAQALGRDLEIPLEQGDPLETVGAALASRGRALILLDNVEQLSDTLPAVLGPWMRQAPELGWLLTSRRRLGMLGERLVDVPPLPARGPTSPAAALFVERAGAVRPGFSITPQNAEAIAELVELLDGLPLAIELAAARIRVLRPAQICQRLSRRFDLLRRRGGDGPARQDTLRSAIDWSWELLSAPERAALAQCSVFEGGFDLEAAEAVVDVEALPDAPWPMDLVEALLDRSLLRGEDTPAGTRFSMLRSIHEYAAERLADPAAVPGLTGPDARATAQTRHAVHYARLGQEAVLDGLHQQHGPLTRRQLRAELPNLAAALSRAPDGATAARAALALLAQMRRSGPLPRAEQHATAALRRDPPPALAARLWVTLSELRSRGGQPEQAADALAAARAAAQTLQDPRLEADIQAALGSVSALRGAYDDAYEHLEAALAGYRRLSVRHAEAMCLTERAHIAGIRGTRFAAARASLDAALQIFSEIGDQAGEAVAQNHLGALCAVQGDLDAGRRAYAASRTLAAAVGDRRTEALSEGMLGAIGLLTGDHTEARAHLEAALSVTRQLGDRVTEAMHTTNYADLLAKMGELEAACAALERAVTISRQIGDRVTEGAALGSLGTLLIARGALREGRARLREGEASLREVGEPTELGKLLCKAAEADLTAGEPATAQRRLSEAERIIATLGAEGTELTAAVERLRARLGVG